MRPFRYLPAMSQPPHRRHLRLPPVRRPSAHPLVSLGRRGLRGGAGAGPAGAARHRRRLVPLVPRHGRRVVRGPSARRVPERPLHLRQGGPGRAARRGRALPAGDPGAHPAGRLAAHRVPDAGGRGVLRRDLLSARRRARAARVPHRARERARGLSVAARPGAVAGGRRCGGVVGEDLIETAPGEASPRAAGRGGRRHGPGVRRR